MQAAVGTALLQALGGAAVIGGAWTAWRQFRSNAQASDRQDALGARRLEIDRTSKAMTDLAVKRRSSDSQGKCDFYGANLRGTDLSGADGLDTCTLTEAIWDPTTIWPNAFSRDDRGMTEVREDALAMQRKTRDGRTIPPS